MSVAFIFIFIFLFTHKSDKILKCCNFLHYCCWSLSILQEICLCCISILRCNLISLMLWILQYLINYMLTKHNRSWYCYTNLILLLDYKLMQSYTKVFSQEVDWSFDIISILKHLHVRSLTTRHAISQPEQSHLRLMVKKWISVTLIFDQTTGIYFKTSKLRSAPIDVLISSFLNDLLRFVAIRECFIVGSSSGFCRLPINCPIWTQKLLLILVGTCSKNGVLFFNFAYIVFVASLPTSNYTPKSSFSI